MKILFRLIAILFTISVLWILLQNIDYSVDVLIFEQFYENVRLPFVLLISFGAGLIMGSLLLTLTALRYKADLMKQRKKEKKLKQELDSLRNLSIDDLSIDKLQIDDEKVIDVPLVDKKVSDNKNEDN